MYDDDPTVEVYETHSEVECPECGYTERDVPDVLGWWDGNHRDSIYITWAHHCTACEYEWTVSHYVEPEGC